MLMFTSSPTNTNELRLMTSQSEKEVSSLATSILLEALPMFLSTILSVLARKAAPHLCKQGLAEWVPVLAEVNTMLCTKNILEVCPYYRDITQHLPAEKRCNTVLPHFRLTVSTRISILAFLLQPLPIQALTTAPNSLQWQVSHPSLSVLAVLPSSSVPDSCTYL